MKPNPCEYFATAAAVRDRDLLCNPVKIPPRAMKKRSGHYCRICGRRRANEKFSGKGHRIHVCKDRARMPKEEREAIEQEEEIFHYVVMNYRRWLNFHLGQRARHYV